MIGPIAGDIIGSVYELHPTKTKNFQLFQKDSKFTDDTVLTCAVAFSVLTGKSYQDSIREFCRRHIGRGYSRRFRLWLDSKDPQPYNSYGNGAAMRVTPIGLAFDTEEDVLNEARKAAVVTHNHVEGIKGAQATALSVFLARSGCDKDTIGREISARFRYNLNRTVHGVRPSYHFDLSCQGTVPEALIAFLDSISFEDAVRNAVSLGGDSDTLACIAGGVAEAYYRSVPQAIVDDVRARLSRDLLGIVSAFERKFPLRKQEVGNE